MILSILARENPDYLLVACDAPGENFRHKLYPEYKLTRDQPPEELICQFGILHEGLEAFGFCKAQQEGYEADDIIATVVKQAAAEGVEVLIYSSDKDLMQIVSDRVQIVDTFKNKVYGPQEVQEKFGVLPGSLRDFLALVGDPSDNIPGVKGIGPKSAAMLVNTWHTLDNVFAHVPLIEQKRLRTALEGKLATAKVSAALVTLCDNVPLNLTLDNLRTSVPDSPAVLQFLKKGFFSLTSKVAELLGDKSEEPLETEETSLKRFVTACYQEGRVGVEVQSGQLRLSTASGKSVRVNLEANIAPEITQLFASGGVLKVVHNLKALRKIVREVVNADDILSMAYALNTSNSKYERIAIQYLKAADPLHPQVLPYLYQCIARQMAQEKKCSLYYRVDKPLVAVASKMEERGIKVSKEELQKTATSLQEKLAMVETDIYREAGEEFLLASPKQLSNILYKKLKLPAPGTVGRAGYSRTDAKALTYLAYDGHKIAAMVLEWRRISKLLGTYALPLLKQVNADTGRIHSTFTLHLTSTGRFSSMNPNLQNLPLDGNIRRAFIAESGCSFLSADYSQIEIRLLAHLARVRKMQDALQAGVDIHTATAMTIFSSKSITAAQRRIAKAINFGIIYGQTPFGLARQLGIDTAQAAKHIEDYFKLYPEINDYMENTIAFAREKGYVLTPGGRCCNDSDINSRNYSLRAFSERAAINAPLQGGAADVVRKAMVSADRDSMVRGTMLLQVHDELIFEVEDNQVQQCAQRIKQIMEQSCLDQCPLTVEIKVGKSLESMQPYQQFTPS